MLAFLVFATWRCNRRPITRGLRFARERLNILFFGRRNSQQLAVLGTLIAAHQLQSTKRLPVKYVATACRPTQLMPRSSSTSQTWACPALFCSSPTAQPGPATIVIRPSYTFLSAPVPTATVQSRPCPAPLHTSPTPISSTVLPCIFRVIVSGSYGASVATCKSLQACVPTAGWKDSQNVQCLWLEASGLSIEEQCLLYRLSI